MPDWDDETWLVLASAPGDAARWCGLRIARDCARGRPPMVAVLMDGSSRGDAAGLARAEAVAMAELGLPAGRLLMMGLRDAAAAAMVPGSALFTVATDAVALLSWMRDCGAVVVAGEACLPIAQAVADSTGIASFSPPLVGYCVHTSRANEVLSSPLPLREGTGEG